MDLRIMITSIFSKPDLLKTFLPLCEGGKTFLEILLVNPKTSQVEGRGFFNDIDFLLDACTSLVGRFNFCLSNFGFSQEKIPTRESFNQFDRTLLDSNLQDQARAHSLTLSLLFKPDLIREMSAQSGSTDQFQSIIYQINAIFSRLNIKSYTVDYFLTGVVLRFCPSGALHHRPINKAALALITKQLVESFEKKMNPQELRRFALTASAMGKLFDPAPGLPGIFAGEGSGAMIVPSSGSLEPAEDAVFSALIEDIFEPKKRVEKENHHAPNIQGLSQNWQETQEAQFETIPNQGLRHEKDYSPVKEEYVDPQARENTKELVAYFHAHSQSKWRWPLYSNTFNRMHKGMTCGEMLVLQSDPFAADVGFQFLMQSAEGFNKDGSGQVLVFSKKRSLGDLALGSLSRHYKGNPLHGKTQAAPDASVLVKTYASIFPNPPQVPPCNRGDGLDELLKYLEHDYILKQKKRGNVLRPLVIVIDNLAEFSSTGEDETFRRLSAIKMRLHEFNGSLWVTHLREAGQPLSNPYQALADYWLTLDHDGSQESSVPGKQPRPSDWEACFKADYPVEMLIKEFSLLKIRFHGHGSHRSFQGHYAYHRPSCLFQEMNAPTASGNTATGQQAAPAPAHQTRKAD